MNTTHAQTMPLDSCPGTLPPRPTPHRRTPSTRSAAPARSAFNGRVLRRVRVGREKVEPRQWP